MKIAWSRPAVQDLHEIHQFISKDSSLSADHLIAGLFDAVERLADFPFLGHCLPDSEDISIKELLSESYRIIYQVQPDRILILSVIHTSRDITRMHPKPWERKFELE